MPTFQTDTLRQYGYELFEAVGCSLEDAQAVVDHLIESDLFGHHSHGALRFYEYARAIREGRFQPRAAPEVVTDNPCAAVVDAHGALGQVGATFAMNLAIDPLLPANVFAGTLTDGVYKSPDGGRRWLPRNAGIQKGTISANVNQLAFHPSDTQTLYAATTVGVFRTMDGGQSWQECMNGMNEINFIVALAVDPKHSNILYAGTSGGVYRNSETAIQNVGDSIKKALEEITNFDGPTLRNQRRERFITLGNDFLSS